ncbi:MAG: hypothetical protein Ct9H90mP16_05390 [Candidatus Poseidoniales archaeon]|nr:MAG: hypothetical protein Ct9H90mP16_05390 [Candidatus Poseidoniales archaeon]
MGEATAAEIRGMPVILPDGRFLGTVHDMVVDSDTWACTHLFVTNPPAELVEDRSMWPFRGDGFVRLRMSFCCVGSPRLPFPKNQ